MKTIEIIYGIVILGAFGAVVAIPYLTHTRGSAAVPVWPSTVKPGPLAPKHQFLADDCNACHTPHHGIVADKCITCHASNGPLLSKQSTAFHANIGDCRGCHIEHQSRGMPDMPGSVGLRPVTMDHAVLAALGLNARPLPPGITAASLPVQHPRITPAETLLDCNACHANQDPHRALFGTDCASCHATSIAQGGWTIPEFRHPSPLSTDCNQCHQAPPSHYMEHFKMISMTVAKVEHADVSQCFLCHQTNAWNDIKGVGWYKHH
ncbi:MAG: class III cytochrome C family protein [Chloroflexi bacterium]|nr:class III cytochrome C family protein [Chloroflexota bacterium]